jgi:diguanylate cyclase (GGDEF)-like protein
MGDVKQEVIDGKWQKVIWRVFAITSCVTFVTSWFLYTFYKVERGQNLSSGAYIFRFIIAPWLVQAFALGVCFIVLKLKNASTRCKNYVVTAMILLVMGVLPFVHYTIIPLMYLPIVTIVATAFFADQVLTVVASIAVAISTCCDIARLHMNTDSLKSGDNTLSIHVGISLMCITLICVVVVIINKHTKELLTSIEAGYTKQLSLSSELLIDPMTGLYNRRSFEDSLTKEIESVENTGEKSFIAIFDIDHFKEVNDTYGHSNGDIVIKALCKMMKEKSKDVGLSFRYGGEEFVVLFHDVELSKVMNVVEDIRTEFRCYYFHFMNKDGITCSCGIAEYTPGESSKAWFNRADSALYKAKETGRNRTVISE